MPLTARPSPLAEFHGTNLPKASSKIEFFKKKKKSQQKQKTWKASVMTDPGLGSSDLGGGDAVLMRCEDFFLSQRGWRGNEKHESKLEY